MSAEVVITELQSMIEALLPNSLGGAVFLVVFCSAILAWPLCLVQPAILRWFYRVLVPFILAYCIYWLPVWCDPNLSRSEYSAWELIGVGIPFGAGVVAIAVVSFVVATKQRATRSESHKSK
ncbi:MAG: hypothetical protein ABSG14_04815 [Verrucomicrobiia bacterium]|jgi:hypothetical protein